MIQNIIHGIPQRAKTSNFEKSSFKGVMGLQAREWDEREEIITICGRDIREVCSEEGQRDWVRTGRGWRVKRSDEFLFKVGHSKVCFYVHGNDLVETEGTKWEEWKFLSRQGEIWGTEAGRNWDVFSIVGGGGAMRRWVQMGGSEPSWSLCRDFCFLSDPWGTLSVSLEVGLREIKERGSDIKLEFWMVGKRAS